MTDARPSTFAVISPCRNEARLMRQTLDSVVAQSRRPDMWVIVDDGSTDDTAGILEDYARRHDWIRVLHRLDRGRRLVGPGVVDAFNDGLGEIDRSRFAFLCKLDLDLALPPHYFERLVGRMEADPRLGICSGKPYVRGPGGALVSERCGDEMAVGMSKFYRTACFDQIGGLERAVMWDAIDCHKARSLGWVVRSWDDPDLRFEHLRPIGASQQGLLAGRRRHGFGQYYMGSHWLFFVATALYRMAQRPYVLGGVAMLSGYFGAMARGDARQRDTGLIGFIRAYQRRALVVGKMRAVAEIERAHSAIWRRDEGPEEGAR